MIKIETHPVDDALTGKSKWWGEPDMPDELDWPAVTVTEDGETYDDPLTFVCQLRCDDIAALDPEGLLPHDGMLYFFAALDYYLGYLDTPAYPGLGEWQQKYFRVLYSPSLNALHTHRTLYPDGSPATMQAEAITFSSCTESDGGINMLRLPYIDEVREEMPGMLSLLQIDCEDRWGLTFHDCGMLHFLIHPEDLHARRWDKVRCYLFSL